MYRVKREGEAQQTDSDNVVPFTATGRRRMVMVPEEEWREVRAALREWKRVRVGCPVARRLIEEG